MSVGTRIVVVDDDRMLLAIVARVFVAQGFAVRAFAEPQRALESVLEEPPDVLLSDCRMPGMSGPELCRSVRERLGTERPFMILWTGDRAHLDADGKRAADVTLDKPTPMAELVRLIERRARVRRRRISGVQPRHGAGVVDPREETG
ncbi:MAG: hypothetical protein SangKO_056260 [Sandaracinaceae bacterium]|nr:hypothetical protein [Myxococcales bacterium]